MLRNKEVITCGSYDLIRNFSFFQFHDPTVLHIILSRPGRKEGLHEHTTTQAEISAINHFILLLMQSWGDVTLMESPTRLQMCSGGGRKLQNPEHTHMVTGTTCCLIWPGQMWISLPTVLNLKCTAILHVHKKTHFCTFMNQTPNRFFFTPFLMILSYKKVLFLNKFIIFHTLSAEVQIW